MFTVQADRVLDTLKNHGVYYVKRSYIQQKYQETSWSFQEAYRFFTSYASDILEKPEEAESPIWLYADSIWAVPDAGTCRLQLAIPRDELLLFDRRKWNRILNLSYVGTEKEEQDFERRMRSQGIMDASDVFMKPYYPQLKAKIQKSWRRLFEGFDEETMDNKEIQGAVWCLKQEWIVEQSESR